jgi:hypothetical protein
LEVCGVGAAAVLFERDVSPDGLHVFKRVVDVWLRHVSCTPTDVEVSRIRVNLEDLNRAKKRGLRQTGSEEEHEDQIEEVEAVLGCGA